MTLRPFWRCARSGPSTDLVGIGAETSGNTLTRFVERGARFAPPPVDARRIAEAWTVEWLHRFDNLAPHGRGRRMVEVNGLWHKSI